MKKTMPLLKETILFLDWYSEFVSCIPSSERKPLVAWSEHFFRVDCRSQKVLQWAPCSGTCGTGALAIFLKKTLELDITTSDYDDVEIESNISKNCHLNGLATLPHIRHTWGEDFPYATPDWDLVIASDILLYVKQYPNLIKTLSNLLKGYKQRGEHHRGHNPSATELFPTDIVTNHPSSSSMRRSRVSSSASLGASEMVGESLPHTSNLATESLTVTLGSRSVDTLNLHFPSSEPAHEDCSRASSSMEAPTLAIQLTSVQAGSLPRPCFLMSWRRRMPEQDESLFFEGCKDAGLHVINLGSRIYCIHQPVEFIFRQRIDSRSVFLHV